MIKSTSKTRPSAFHKALLTAGLLSGAAFTTLGFTPAAKAFTGNLTGLLAAAPFSAGDKTYSNFSFTGFAAGYRHC